MMKKNDRLRPLPRYYWEYCSFGESNCLFCSKFCNGYRDDRNKFLKERHTVTCDMYRNGVPQDILLNKVKCEYYEQFLYDTVKAKIEEAVRLLEWRERDSRSEEILKAGLLDWSINTLRKYKDELNEGELALLKRHDKSTRIPELRSIRKLLKKIWEF